MKKMWLTLCATLFFSTLLTSSPSEGATNPQGCPSVSGKWNLDNPKIGNPIMNIKQRNCRIEGRISGKESSLRLEKGEWVEGEGGFKYEGELTTFEDKCDAYVTGVLKLNNDKLTTRIQPYQKVEKDGRQREGQQVQCKISGEFTDELVFSRKP